MKISPARTAAFDILYRIESQRAFSSVLLPEYEGELSPPDRALCHEICLGVLRRRMLLDGVIDQLTGSKSLDLAVRLAVRIGIYQLKYLDRVPAYSAINDSVNLVQRAKKTSAKGFVNAVLRNFQRTDMQLSFEDDVERVSVETSHPRWLIEKWIGEFGREGAEAIAEIDNSPLPIAFRFTANPHLREFNLENYSPSRFVKGCFLADRMDAELAAASEAGALYFQDEGSQVVGAAAGHRKPARFLDVCAAPGSKTTQVAVGRGANSASDLIVAGDLHRPRVEFLRNNCRSQGVDFVNVVQYDAADGLPFEEKVFDTVLVDAPCSGTGTIRHNPEIRYFLDESDFRQLTFKQLRILRNASKLVKRGGRLIYSTCSLEREENEEVCEQYLSEARDFLQQRPDVPEEFVCDRGYARTFPHRDNMDGFFIAAFERVG